jgi:hypothetical protein
MSYLLIAWPEFFFKAAGSQRQAQNISVSFLAGSCILAPVAAILISYQAGTSIGARRKRR